MPVWTPSKSGEKFEIALRSVKIANLNSTEPILQALRYVMVLVGLRGNNLPGEHETTILVNYIVQYYGGHTPEEIRLAFEKAISGELDLDDVTCYENFSVLYFSKIMSAYRLWATEQYQHVSIPGREEVPTPTQSIEDLHRGDVEYFYQRIRKGKIPYNLPDYFKDILVKDGLMKEEENLTEFFVQKLGNGSVNIYVPVFK